jgi:hypothetical protein
MPASTARPAPMHASTHQQRTLVATCTPNSIEAPSLTSPIAKQGRWVRCKRSYNHGNATTYKTPKP